VKKEEEETKFLLLQQVLCLLLLRQNAKILTVLQLHSHAEYTFFLNFSVLKNLLTPWSGVLLEKLLAPNIVKNVSSISWKPRLQLPATRTCLDSNQCSPRHNPIFKKINFNIILHLLLGLSIVLFPSGFPTIPVLYVSRMSHPPHSYIFSQEYN
jgi:hypothetical protein